MTELDEALKVVRAAGYTVLEGDPETVTEWGVLGGRPLGYFACSEEEARSVVENLRGTRLVRRSVSRSPWVEVPAEENSRG